MRRYIWIFCLSVVCFFVSCKSQNLVKLGSFNVEKNSLLYQDSFENGLDKWVVEKESVGNSEVFTENDRLIIDVGGGATVWFHEKIDSPNILIQYDRTVIINNGENDRLSDLNQFWMAKDLGNKNLFTRSGSFREYDSLRMYYAGIGGNRNSTTRFRKYHGDGERELIHDLKTEKYLLEPNKSYFVQILVLDGVTKVFVNGEEYLSYLDKDPLTEGYFGFRTVQSHQKIDDFKVFSINQK
ncbi:DUF6250 domain-containing protein [Christiangramia crocea]|uniref:DUF6250 domain-containing protein n=1 Tax=Christiangramia crocea TaxID=2904124 RepID=A0A9X1UTL4_9FLAO|nr:DUF6250 domain-containing protein [Gramella crocea]MCG9970014.1 DUF6250 domain-containing protein [Gramella crocea]